MSSDTAELFSVISPEEEMRTGSPLANSDRFTAGFMCTAHQVLQ